MLYDQRFERTYQPDAELINSLHRLLELVSDDRLAYSIDYVVAYLIRCNSRPAGTPPEALPLEMMEYRKSYEASN